MTSEVSILTAVHDDTDAAIYRKKVKDSNEHFIIILIIYSCFM